VHSGQRVGRGDNPHPPRGQRATGERVEAVEALVGGNRRFGTRANDHIGRAEPSGETGKGVSTPSTCLSENRNRGTRITDTVLEPTHTAFQVLAKGD